MKFIDSDLYKGTRGHGDTGTRSADDAASGSPGAQVAGEVARMGIRVPCRHAQRRPGGQGGHGLGDDHRGLDRHSPAPHAGPAAHHPRPGLRLLLASERAEVAQEMQGEVGAGV